MFAAKKALIIISIILFTLYFIGCDNLLGSDSGGSTGDTTEDTTAPVAGNSGTITTSNVTSSSIDLSWTKANDNVSTQSNIRYMIVYSQSDNIGTVDSAEANGTIEVAWTSDISSASVNHLSSSTTYYLNVVVKDSTGNKAVYSTTSATTNTPSWKTVGTEGFSTGYAVFTEIALTSSNLPYVVYQDNSRADNAATVMKYDSGTWSVVGSEGFSIGQADSTEIVLDANDVPYVGYRDGSNGDSITVKKYNDTSGWTTVGSPAFSDFDVGQTSLAINSTDILYVAYSDGGQSNKSTVEKFNETDTIWETVGSKGFSAGQANDLDINFNSTDVPYVAYRDMSETDYAATVMKYDSTTNNWLTVGSSGFSQGGASYTNIVFDSNDVPYVVYNDAANSNKATVQKYNGTSWEVVGTVGFSAGAVGYIDIAIDSKDSLYVAYKDTGNSNKATVQKYNGTSWEVVGTAGLSTSDANYTSIAFTSYDIPIIVYEDKANSYKATVKQFN